MISRVAWSYDTASEKWGAALDGGREVSIGWDEKDRAYYLAVIVMPPPNVEGGQARVYVAPLTLLAAMLLLPKVDHPRLVQRVRDALTEARDGRVIAELESVVSDSIKAWPDPARASEALSRAMAAMPDVERLSLDMAAAGAWGDA